MSIPYGRWGVEGPTTFRLQTKVGLRLFSKELMYSTKTLNIFLNLYNTTMMTTTTKLIIIIVVMFTERDGNNENIRLPFVIN